ncbi:MAG: PAS domain S-box protein [Halioglobus sp.]|nr:PAS domain S-box protein [Halioglobus sp.]
MTDGAQTEELLARIRSLEAQVAEVTVRNEQVTKNSKDMIWITDKDHNLSYVSPVVETMLGFSQELVVGQHLLTNDRSEDRAEILFLLKKIDGFVSAGDVEALKRIEFPEREAQLVNSERDLICTEVRMSLLLAEDDTFLGLMGVNRDVSERNKIQASLKWNESLFRAVFEASPEAVCIIDIETGKYVDVNNTFCQATGWSREEAVGQSPSELELWLIPGEEEKLRLDIVKNGVALNFEAQFRNKDGSVSVSLISVSIFSIGDRLFSLSLSRDIKELRQAQEEKLEMEVKLYRAQRLDSIGTLAGGVAHDFNNMLMGIQGNLSLVERDIQDSSLSLTHVQKIEQLVTSASQLTAQLLGLARDGSYETAAADMNQLVVEQVEFFRRTHSGISVKEDYKLGLPSVDVDLDQIRQVLLNLFLNAWNAMSNARNLTLTTDCVELTEEQGLSHQVDAGQYIKVAVQDSGTGMDAATMEKIFDPFFTTNEVGKGAGLGLASAYSIIKNHRGFIAVSSVLSEGSTFEIYLPSSSKPIQSATVPSTKPQTGTESILVVDDEQRILDVISSMLEMLGYGVFSAEGGEKALTILHENPSIELVVLDMLMPGMDGVEAFTELKKISKDLKVIISSGFSAKDQMAEILVKGCDAFLAKPFNLVELSTKVRQVLDT